MSADGHSCQIIHLHRYRAEPADHKSLQMKESLHPTPIHQMLMGTVFAHVLNVPSSEELWPGDAAMLFFPQYFAMRLVGEDEVYRRRGVVWDHIRDEVLRLCDCFSYSLEQAWRSEHKVYCYNYDGSFAKELFGDGSDDDLEPDTLNSELLLTEEYIAPDACQQSFHGTTGPQCPVGAFQPTEQED